MSVLGMRMLGTNQMSAAIRTRSRPRAGAAVRGRADAGERCPVDPLPCQTTPARECRAAQDLLGVADQRRRLRTSPIRSVSLRASKYSPSGIVNLRLCPVRVFMAPASMLSCASR